MTLEQWQSQDEESSVVGGFDSFHAGGGNFAFCDGAVRFLSHRVDPKIYRLMGHRADGELFSLDEAY